MPTEADRPRPRETGDLRVAAQSVRAIAVRNMREAIMSGQFQPGERLVEADMCVRLGISRPSLREALRSLEAEKLVVIVPHRGPAIPVLTIAEAREIYDVRLLLEGEAAALSAARCSAEAVAAMRRALDAFDAALATRDLRGQVKATRDFYDRILSTCGNTLIGEMLNTLVARITLLRMTSMSLEGRGENSSRELWAIFKHIAKGNPKKARAAAVDHVGRARDAALRTYAADLPADGTP